MTGTTVHQDFESIVITIFSAITAHLQLNPLFPMEQRTDIETIV